MSYNKLFITQIVVKYCCIFLLVRLLKIAVLNDYLYNNPYIYITQYNNTVVYFLSVSRGVAMSLSAHSHFGMWATGLVEVKVSGIQPAPWFAWNANLRIFIYSSY